MAMTFVRFRLEHPILRDTLERVPDMSLEWERSIPGDGGNQMLFWADDGDFDDFETAMEADPTIRPSRAIDVGDRRLYQVELVGEGAETDLYPIVIDTGSVVLQATVTADGWHGHFGFANRSSLERFFDTCREHDISFEIDRLYEPTDGVASSVGPWDRLTDKQQRSLLAAWKRGYFDVPKRTQLEDIASDLGITDTALSQRMRRGIATLIAESSGESGNGQP